LVQGGSQYDAISALQLQPSSWCSPLAAHNRLLTLPLPEQQHLQAPAAQAQATARFNIRLAALFLPCRALANVNVCGMLVTLYAAPPVVRGRPKAAGARYIQLHYAGQRPACHPYHTAPSFGRLLLSPVDTKTPAPTIMPVPSIITWNLQQHN
jgi:hypothetical protein